MSAAGRMNNMMDKNGATIHTAFPARVISCDGTTAKIQPLFNYNGQAAAAIDDIPVPQSVRKYQVIEESVEEGTTHWTKASPPEAGDIVYCLCAEQTLGASWQGIAVDRVGNLHHQLGDAVIVAIF